MKLNDFEKKAFQKAIQNLFEKNCKITEPEDCYCALMKQMMLSNPSLN